MGAAFPLCGGGRARSKDGAGGPELRGTAWNGAAGGLSPARWSARRCSRQQDSPTASRWPGWCSRMTRAWRAAILRVERPPSRWFVSACRLPPPPARLLATFCLSPRLSAKGGGTGIRAPLVPSAPLRMPPAPPYPPLTQPTLCSATPGRRADLGFG